jgi:hypothetical protein
MQQAANKEHQKRDQRNLQAVTEQPGQAAQEGKTALATLTVTKTLRWAAARQLLGGCASAQVRIGQAGSVLMLKTALRKDARGAGGSVLYQKINTSSKQSRHQRNHDYFAE